MIKLLIIGPNGKMGRAMIHQAHYHPTMKIVGGVGPKGCKYLGRDLGVIAGIGENLGVIAYDDFDDIVQRCDVVLECTHAEASIDFLQKCVAAEKPLVSGTTGFSEEEKAQFQRAGEIIPVLLASNTSKIAHLYFHIIEWITEKVGLKADIDIIEMHDRNKMDAPSGTSKQIGHLIAEKLDKEFDEIARYHRKGKGSRPSHTIDYTSIRTGNFSTSNKVIFGFENEKLELSIDGYNMLPYAAGMIEAAEFIQSQKPGFYTIEQAFGSDA
jgi:4-hydroxy-tetrahydrodipicolinate reductase